MNKKLIYGYMFDCNTFEYNNRTITGFCCGVKASTDKGLEVALTKEKGFTILVNNKATELPYKIYVLAQSENKEEELIEIDSKVFWEHFVHIIEDVNASPEAAWSPE